MIHTSFFFIPTGLGAGCTHVSATVIIGEYFTTSYTSANGIAYVGPGVGVLVFPPLIQQLIHAYGWRGSVFIQGAIAFNIVAAACLFRPPKRRPADEVTIPYGNVGSARASVSVDFRNFDEKCQTEEGGPEKEVEMECITPVVRHVQSSASGRSDNDIKATLDDRTVDAKASADSRSHFDKDCQQDRSEEGICIDRISVQSSGKPCQDPVSENHEGDSERDLKDRNPDVMKEPIAMIEEGSGNVIVETKFAAADMTKYQVSKFERTNVHEPMSADSGSDTKEPKTVDDGSNLKEPVALYGDERTNVKELFRLEDDDINLNERTSVSVSDRTTTRGQFRSTCAKYLPTVPVLFVCFLMFFISVGYISVIVHSVARASETGVSDSEASLVISVMGASSIFSRVTHGLCIDRGWISALGVEIAMLTLSTVATYMTLVVEGFAILMVFAVLIGVASGVYFTLIPVIIRQVDDTERFSYNLGLVLAISALGDLCGGYFTGRVATFVCSFYCCRFSLSYYMYIRNKYMSFVWVGVR